MVLHNCRSFLEKSWNNCECVTVTLFLSQLSQILSAQLRQVLAVVAKLLWNIAIFVTVWPMIVETCVWMLTANYIVGLNERSTNESTHPDCGGSFSWGLNLNQAAFSTTLTVQPSLLYKINGKKQDSSLLLERFTDLIMLFNKTFFYISTRQTFQYYGKFYDALKRQLQLFTSVKTSCRRSPEEHFSVRSCHCWFDACVRLFSWIIRIVLCFLA